jgi:hypothetical protein
MESKLTHKQIQLNFDDGISVDFTVNIEFKNGKVYFPLLHISSNKKVEIPTNPTIIEKNGKWSICEKYSNGKIEYYNNKYATEIIRKLKEWVLEIEDRHKH